MATTNSATLKSGTWLVIGLLALATVLVIISRVYRTPPPEDGPEILQQQGLPAARRGMDLSREGKKLLPVEEQHEMDALYAEALQARFQSLSARRVASTSSAICRASCSAVSNRIWESRIRHTKRSSTHC